jgi:regulator of RNase E activity RraA
MDDLAAGDICMLDARTVRDGAVWGDLRSLVAQRRGVAGAIADGLVRDTDACSALGFPVFARCATPMSGSGRAWIEAKGVPIVVGGVPVAPGDFVLADGDGVVIVPAEAEARVFERAVALEEADQRMVAAIEGGMSLGDARRAFGAKKTLASR